MEMVDKICRLLEAGYTREEIAQILNPAAIVAPGDNPPTNAPIPAAPVPAAPVADNPVPVVPSPAAPAGGGVANNGSSEVITAIQQMGNNIVSALQRASLGGAVLPYNPDPGAAMDAITAQIINPNGGKK